MIAKHEVYSSYSRTHYYKKITKPQLERKRRARINRCLEELKELMVGALMVENQSASRLEKADVLELTVKHLQGMKKVTKAQEEAYRFQAGFTQCAAEACNFLLNFPGVDSHISQQLVDHLQTIVGPLSIQVPNFRLILPSEDNNSNRDKTEDNSTGGLLMVADGKSHVTSDGDVDTMWRPW